MTPALLTPRYLDILRAGGSWMTAAEIAMCDDSFNDRRLRAIAEAAGSRILSWPGSPGYRLTSQATIEEVNHAVDALTSQSKKMIVRATSLLGAYHRSALA